MVTLCNIRCFISHFIIIICIYRCCLFFILWLLIFSLYDNGFCCQILFKTCMVVANLRVDAFISSLLSSHQYHDDDDHHHECSQKERRLAFCLIWLNRACIDLTSKRARQDIYRKKKTREREREREIAARSVNINQASLSYTWACIEQTGERSSS